MLMRDVVQTRPCHAADAAGSVAWPSSGQKQQHNTVVQQKTTVRISTRSTPTRAQVVVMSDWNGTASQSMPPVVQWANQSQSPTLSRLSHAVTCKLRGVRLVMFISVP